MRGLSAEFTLFQTQQNDGFICEYAICICVKSAAWWDALLCSDTPLEDDQHR